MKALTLTFICAIGLVFIGASALSRSNSTGAPDSVGAAILSEAPEPQGGVSLEQDTNRPGSDYRWGDIREDPAICRDACANDPTCQAFTYVKPGVQGPSARCYLKSGVPNAQGNDCCVSGVKSGGSTAGALEVNIDRRGGDYKHYELSDVDPYQCKKDCINDSNCRAFTYVRPSFFGRNAHCFLKNIVPEGTQNGCCISGVVRPGGGGGGDFSGSWSWDYGFDQVTLNAQNPNNVTGSYNGRYERYRPGGGRISGEVSGNTLSFSWNDASGEGDGYVTLQSDGSLKGRWCKGRGCDARQGTEFNGSRPK